MSTKTFQKGRRAGRGNMGKSGDFIKGIYEALARGDVLALLSALDPAVQWREAENFLYADRNPYIGPQAVAEGVLQRLVANAENLKIVPANFIDGGDTVVVEGRYKGKVKATGREFDAQFAHVWELREGKVVRFQQYTDTKQFAAATES